MLTSQIFGSFHPFRCFSRVGMQKVQRQQPPTPRQWAQRAHGLRFSIWDLGYFVGKTSFYLSITL